MFTHSCPFHLNNTFLLKFGTHRQNTDSGPMTRHEKIVANTPVAFRLHNSSEWPQRNSSLVSPSRKSRVVKGGGASIMRSHSGALVYTRFCMDRVYSVGPLIRNFLNKKSPAFF